MLNRFLLILFLIFPLFGEEQITFLSNEVGVEGDNVIAYKNATALYKNRYMRADTIVYNQVSKEIEFFGNVSIVENGLYFFVGDYAKISIKDGDATIRKMFLYHKPRHIWLYSNQSKSTPEAFILKDTFLSSCRSENPDWGFYIQDGTYQKKEHYFELYNTVLYIKDIPVFYIPYINFSINRERKSGLLVPRFGFSSKEGFFYSQPIYYVPNYWSDLEVSPQTRANRGNGIYMKYRFADSPYSRGYFSAGYFREKESFFETEQLAHKEEYGFRINYKRSSLFPKVDDALFIDINYLNDISHLYLQQYDKNENSDISNLIESKVNYLIHYKNNYLGFYNSYIIDTSLQSNDKTLQTLPQIQYHYGLDSVFNNFLYSFNYSYKNLTREEGVTANLHEMTIPIIFYWRFFNNYLGFKLTENFYSSYIDFENNQEYSEQSNYYLRQYHQLELFTDLAKKYKNGYFHSVSFGANLIIPDIERKSGFYTPENESVDCKVGDICEFQREDKIDSTLEFKFAQYLYNSSGRELFYHKIFQPIIVEGGKIIKPDTVTNEFKYSWTKKTSFYNRVNYSFDEKKFTQLSSTFQFGLEDFKFELSHFKEKSRYEENSESLGANTSFKFGKKYSIFGHYDYDLYEDDIRGWGVGYEMKKRCWSYRIDYQKEYFPRQTQTGADRDIEQKIQFLIELFPLGSFDYEIK